MSDEELEELIGGLIFVGIIAGFFVFLFETSMLNAILELTMDEHISRFPGGDLYALIYLFIYFSIYGFIVWWFCESPEDLLYILSPVFVGSYLLIVLLGTEDFCMGTYEEIVWCKLMSYFYCDNESDIPFDILSDQQGNIRFNPNEEKEKRTLRKTKSKVNRRNGQISG